MFQCQYCNSHIMVSSSTEFTDLTGLTKCQHNPHGFHEPAQAADFYVSSPSMGELVYATENYGLVRIGRMRYWLPDDSNISTTPQLHQNRIYQDRQLNLSLAQDLMRQVGRPHFEVRLESNPNIQFEFKTLSEAIRHMFKLEGQRNPSHIKYAVDEVMETLKPSEGI